MFLIDFGDIEIFKCARRLVFRNRTASPESVALSAAAAPDNLDTQVSPAGQREGDHVAAAISPGDDPA